MPNAQPRLQVLTGALCAAVLLVVLVTVWAAPRVSGDTFVALAGGRDVFRGKLGKPDDWSFTTSGRVWLNQNWGFDAVAYGLTRAAGEDGLLALKALMLLAIAAAVVAASRTRGAPWPAALLVTAAALAGARWHVELRANLATYLMTPVLVLLIYRSARRPRRIWLTVPVIAAWANLHGGFVLGFALLGLWALATAARDIRSGGLGAAARGLINPLGALAVSVALSGVVTPFGLENLAYPLTYVSSPEWREITEWQPVSLTAMRGPATVWEFALVLAAVVAGAGWRWLAGRRAGEERDGDRPDARASFLFDLGLTVAMTAMALSAVRFAPVALLGLAPLASYQVGLISRARRPWVPAAVGALTLAAALLPYAGLVAARYSRDNPRFTDETVFLRMVGVDRMPSGAGGFLADNGVTGRALNDWRWEGYLRWSVPAVRLFMGGRATQIYSLENLHAYRQIAADPHPAAALARWDVHLAVVSTESTDLEFARRLAFTGDAHWAPVFYDGRSLVLADLKAPEIQALANRVVGGTARFRDGAVRALSAALCRVSPAWRPADPQAVPALVTANLAFPTAGGPWFLLFAAADRQLPPQWVAQTLEQEEATLAAAPERGAGSLPRLRARAVAAQILATLYRASGQQAKAATWAGSAENLKLELESALDRS